MLLTVSYLNKQSFAWSWQLPHLRSDGSCNGKEVSGVRLPNDKGEKKKEKNLTLLNTCTVALHWWTSLSWLLLFKSLVGFRLQGCITAHVLGIITTAQKLLHESQIKVFSVRTIILILFAQTDNFPGMFSLLPAISSLEHLAVFESQTRVLWYKKLHRSGNLYVVTSVHRSVS